MSKIQEAFAGGKAFIPFITCGDPDLETTGRIVRAMAQAGADLIELGIPFSDPTAEGPVIQGANIRALAGGVTTDQIFDFVRALRKDVAVPLVFMTYANVVFSFGIDRFAEACAEAGIDGLILPDVPHEEKEEFAPAFRQRGIDFISLIAPTSQNRIAEIAADAEGFLYLVSSLGVTGERTEFSRNLTEIVSDIRANTKIPVAVGFGVSAPEQAAEIAQYADGVIVGSAIVKRIGQYGTEAAPQVAAYVSEMKRACAGV